MELNKVKDRIAKLLAKANNNSSEAEAQVAMARARKLMDKYQLDEMDVSVAAEEDVFGVEFADEVYSYTPKWREWIAVQVARYNDCQCRIMTVAPGGVSKAGSTLPNKSMLAWRGFKTDVAIAKQMYSYICDVVDNATSAYMREQGYTRYNARIGTIFKEAMATRIVSRLHWMQKEREEAAASEASNTSGMSLMVYKANQVVAYFGEAGYKNAKKIADAEDMDAEEVSAYISGDEAGQEAAIITVLEEQDEQNDEEEQDVRDQE